MTGTLLLIASFGGASWALIFIVAAIICLFIAAFIADGVGSNPPPRISFGWAGMFFLALAIATGG